MAKQALVVAEMCKGLGLRFGAAPGRTKIGLEDVRW